PQGPGDPRPAAAGGRSGAAHRAGHQALQRPAPDRDRAPGGAGQPGGDPSGAAADGYGHGDQHGLHRAAQRDLPGQPDGAGAARAGVAAPGEAAAGGGVPGGLRLQLLLGTRQPADNRATGGRSEVAGSDAGDGRGADRPCVVAGRTVGLAGGAGAVESAPQAATPAARSGSSRSDDLGSLITVACGATRSILSTFYAVFPWFPGILWQIVWHSLALAPQPPDRQSGRPYPHANRLPCAWTGSTAGPLDSSRRSPSPKFESWGRLGGDI